MHFPNIQKLRRSRGYTQEEMANALGVTKRCYGAWERGERDFTLEDAWAMADVLDCTLDEIAGREIPEHVEPEYPSDVKLLMDAYDALDEDAQEAAVASLIGMAAVRSPTHSATFMGQLIESALSSLVSEENDSKALSDHSGRDDSVR